VEAAIVVQPSYGLTDGEIARMLQESIAHANDDMAARVIAEAQVDADQLVAATRAALNADGDLLDPTARRAIDEAIAEVVRLRDAGDPSALTAAIEALNRATGEFAARRMDRGVARALTGRSIDALT
jgi:molecular chaperone HscA